MAAFAAPASAQPAEAVVIVLPFENPSGDARLQWLREGSALLLSDVLTAAGLDVVSRDERALAFERLQLPESAVLTRASAIKVGLAVGATVVVIGRVERAGDQIALSARRVLLEEGRILAEVTERGPIAGTFATMLRLGQALAGLQGRTIDWTPPPSLAAFELFARALGDDEAASRRQALERAIALEPGYDAARLELWHLDDEQGQHQRAFEVARAISNSRFVHEGRFLAALSLLRLGRPDEAYTALRTLQGEAPAAAIANAVGVVQLRRGGSAQTGRATYYFNQAAEMDPADPDFTFNLGYAYWWEKDPGAAIYWLRETVRRDPADADAHGVMAAALAQTGAATEAARERELAAKLSSRYGGDARAAGAADAIPRGLERLKSRLDRPSAHVDTLATAAGQRDQAALASFYMDAARRAVDRGADREALQELRRALYLSPYLAEAHLLVGRLHLKSGRADEAVEALKIALWSEESAAGHLTLAEAYLDLDNAAAARIEVDRALALDPTSQAARDLRDRLALGKK